jgi:hypothetical protein
MILRNLWILGFVLCPYSISGFLFRHKVGKTCSRTCTIRRYIDVENGRSNDENIVIKSDDTSNIIFFASSREVNYFGQQIANAMESEFRAVDFFDSLNTKNSDIEKKEIFYPKTKKIGSTNLSSCSPDMRISAVYIDPEKQSSSASAISALASIVEKVRSLSLLIFWFQLNISII